MQRSCCRETWAFLVTCACRATRPQTGTRPRRAHSVARPLRARAPACLRATAAGATLEAEAKVEDGGGPGPRSTRSMSRGRTRVISRLVNRVITDSLVARSMTASLRLRAHGPSCFARMRPRHGRPGRERLVHPAERRRYIYIYIYMYKQLYIYVYIYTHMYMYIYIEI